MMLKTKTRISDEFAEANSRLIAWGAWAFEKRRQGDYPPTSITARSMETYALGIIPDHSLRPEPEPPIGVWEIEMIVRDLPKQKWIDVTKAYFIGLGPKEAKARELGISTRQMDEILWRVRCWVQSKISTGRRAQSA